jgi:hypothetical protein
VPDGKEDRGPDVELCRPGGEHQQEGEERAQVPGNHAVYPSYRTKHKYVVYTANEGTVRIQYKTLVPIYVFLEMKLLFPKQNYNVLCPSSKFRHSYICERFIYFQDQSAYSVAGNIWKTLTDA